MSLESFEAHIRDPAPGFRCFSCSDRQQRPTFLARVKNYIGPSGHAEAVTAASEACGSVSPGLTRFVELHDGILLYRDSKSDTAGVEFFKTSEWRSRTKEMRASMAEMDFEDNDMPDWFYRGVVFGEIPHSANYFVMHSKGNEAGQVFYCDHDDFQTEPVAASFEDLLGMIVHDPPGFLYQCGCFARYSDGKTDIQWVPKEYVPDCSGG